MAFSACGNNFFPPLRYAILHAPLIFCPFCTYFIHVLHCPSLFLSLSLFSIITPPLFFQRERKAGEAERSRYTELVKLLTDKLTASEERARHRNLTLPTSGLFLA